MPSVAPYILLMLDGMYLFTACQQLLFRWKIHRRYNKLEVVKEQIVSKRKDAYRVVITVLLCIKFFYALSWLLYQGWGNDNLKGTVKLWHFWVYYGVITSIAMLIQGDFASVVVGIERNISNRGKSKRLWKAVLMASAVLSAILCMWGISLSIRIDTTPIWPYFGFIMSIFTSFITYTMTRSIITTTRETQESTYHVRQSITAKEFETQLVTLFTMKQMLVALVVMALHAAFSFVVYLYYIVIQKIMTQPFIGSPAWYLWCKLILFNGWVYSIVSIIMIYTWISYRGIKEAAIKNERKGTLTTPRDHENEIVVMPDTFAMEYATPNIDPNDPHNELQATYHRGSVDQQHVPSGISIKIQPIDLDPDNLQQPCNRNNSPLSAHSSPPTPNFDENAPDANGNAYAFSRSPVSKLSVASQTEATTQHPQYVEEPAVKSMSPSNKRMEPQASFLEAAPKENEYEVLTAEFTMFGHKLSIGHHQESSLNVDNFIRESKKDRPRTTMFDMDIVNMKDRGVSLERIYFDSQKYRGITPKSLKLTARMRAVSYSPNASRAHSRRNTLNTTANLSQTMLSYTEPTNTSISKGNHPPYLPKQHTVAITIGGTHNPYNPHMNQQRMPISQVSNDTLLRMTAEEEELSRSHDSQASFTTTSQHKYADSDTESVNSQKTGYKPPQNVQRINLRNPINITVPEDAVLTPHKDRRDGNPMDVNMDIKSPESGDIEHEEEEKQITPSQPSKDNIDDAPYKYQHDNHNSTSKASVTVRDEAAGDNMQDTPMESVGTDGEEENIDAGVDYLKQTMVEAQTSNTSLASKSSIDSEQEQLPETQHLSLANTVPTQSHSAYDSK